MLPGARHSSFRFLRSTGTVTFWPYPVFLLFLAWLTYLRVTAQRPSFAHYFILFLVPVAAGTGLLTIARSGQLDLVIGAGVNRNRLWATAFAHAFVVPVTIALMAFAVTTTSWTTWARVPAVLCFTGGIGFAVGIVELRYAAGIIWILLRLLFVMTPAGLSLSMQLSKGPDLPSPARLLLLVVAAPESALESRMPIAMVAGIAFLGAAALLTSLMLFRRADFGGKRT